MTFVIRPSVFFLVFFANTEDNEVDCHGSVKPGNRSFGYFSRPLLEGEKGQVSKVLIIDAKYYGHTTQVQYDKHTLHSNNLYQIFTYVKNKDAWFGDKPHEVSGMLLYARTDEEIQPDHTYLMSGNKISVKTLDLNCEFSVIAAQLNAIADSLIS